MNRYGTPENLIRFDRMTPEQHKELSRRGGIRSGEVRRELRRRREMAQIMQEILIERQEAAEEH